MEESLNGWCFLVALKKFIFCFGCCSTSFRKFRSEGPVGCAFWRASTSNVRQSLLLLFFPSLLSMIVEDLCLTQSKWRLLRWHLPSHFHLFLVSSSFCFHLLSSAFEVLCFSWLKFRSSPAVIFRFGIFDLWVLVFLFLLTSRISLFICVLVTPIFTLYSFSLFHCTLSWLFKLYQWKSLVFVRKIYIIMK